MPALAVAVQQSITVEFIANHSKQLTINFEQGSQHCKIADLPALKQRLDNAYRQFEQGKLSITQLLSKPTELLFYTLANAQLQSAGELNLTTKLPIGSGMGSSAACIAALLRLSEAVTQRQAASAPALSEQVRYCERLQHGHGSLIDAATVSFGGLIKLKQQQISKLSATFDSHWYIWDSGKPQSSTGEVVSQVRQQHGNSDIWQAFADTTEQLEQQLTQTTANPNSIRRLIRCNHQLLQQIGVVPKATAQVINRLEQLGGAAKICGAGCLGEQAGGQVLCYLPQLDTKQIANQLKLKLRPLEPNHRGAYVIAH